MVSLKLTDAGLETAAYGPGGSRAYGQAYNPRTGTYAQTRQGSNVYGNWGTSSVQRGDNWAQTARVTNNATGNTTRVTRTDNGAAISHRGGPGAHVQVTLCYLDGSRSVALGRRGEFLARMTESR